MDLSGIRIRLVAGLAFTLLILLLSTACSTLQRPEAPTRAPYDQATNAVELSSVCAEGISKGSGVLVASDTVWTAAHVALCDDGTPAILVGSTAAGDEFLVFSSQSDAAADVAKLTISHVPFRSAVSVRPMYQWGEVCLEAGWPMRERKCGRVQHPATWGRPGFWRTSIRVQPGNSGSGVYDDLGRLVGVATHSIGPFGEYGSLVASLSPHVQEDHQEVAPTVPWHGLQRYP